MIPGNDRSDRIPASLNTAASAAKTLPSTNSQLSAFHMVKDTLFIDPAI